MPVPLQITFRGIDHSDAIESAIRRRAARLDRFESRITSCHIIVDMPHHRRHTGNHYAVRIDIKTASGEVVVKRDPALDDTHKDFQAVLRDAFDAATRHLESDAQREEGDVKQHEHRAHGRVTRLFPDDGYGFLTTSDGEEVYFHQNSVQEASFDQLRLGSDVGFTLAPEDSDQGSRAASVHLLQA
jgi:cold shock CspA family protein